MDTAFAIPEPPIQITRRIVELDKGAEADEKGMIAGADAP